MEIQAEGGQNNFFNDHELLVEKLYCLFIFCGLFN